MYSPRIKLIKKLIDNFYLCGTNMAANLDIIPINQWLTKEHHPLIIAGPCSAESEEQVLTTAHELSKIPSVKVFRAGIWKPRTRPNYFEGIGKVGLKWLQKAKSETGLKIAVEVATPHHVEDCLNHNIDMVWIGARTVVNPFSVQEITDALRNTDTPVLVKNPINPDLKLWIGAIERVYQVGIKKITAVHRGFYSMNKSQFRNPPLWEIPIALKRAIPNIPILVDPSHICGNTEYIAHISQKAMDLEMDGLMIEAHHDPIHALSDANQQITPNELKNLLEHLIIRDKSGNKEFQDKLTGLREKIDEIDLELLEILGRRMSVVKEIGQYKKEHKITILQLKRWTYILENRLKTGLYQGIEKQFLLNILEMIHIESMRLQTEILNS
jgi:chorismate mutase